MGHSENIIWLRSMNTVDSCSRQIMVYTIYLFYIICNKGHNENSFIKMNSMVRMYTDLNVAWYLRTCSGVSFEKAMIINSVNRVTIMTAGRKWSFDVMISVDCLMILYLKMMNTW